MILKVYVTVIVIQAVMCYRRDNTLNCAPSVSRSVSARTDVQVKLLKALKLVLANVQPTRKERMAAHSFVAFLNSDDSGDYLEVFYPKRSNRLVKDFISFLNGILFNAYPNSPEWKAAQILMKMIKTKLPSEIIKKIRKKELKRGRKSNIPRLTPSKRFVDYMKLFRYPTLLPGNMEDIYRRIYNMHKNGLVLPVHSTLTNLYKNLLKYRLFDTKCSDRLVVPNCKLLRRDNEEVGLLPIAQAIRILRQTPLKHLMYKDKELSVFNDQKINHKPYATTIFRYK